MYLGNICSKFYFLRRTFLFTFIEDNNCGNCGKTVPDHFIRFLWRGFCCEGRSGELSTGALVTAPSSTIGVPSHNGSSLGPFTKGKIINHFSPRICFCFYPLTRSGACVKCELFTEISLIFLMSVLATLPSLFLSRRWKYQLFVMLTITHTNT